MFSYISMRHLTLRPFLLSFTKVPLLYPYLSILECPSTEYRVWVRVEKQKTENLEATTTSSIQYYTLVFYSTTESETESERESESESESSSFTTHLLSYLLSLLLFILLTLSILLLEVYSSSYYKELKWSEVRRYKYRYLLLTFHTTTTQGIVIHSLIFVTLSLRGIELGSLLSTISS